MHKLLLVAGLLETIDHNQPGLHNNNTGFYTGIIWVQNFVMIKFRVPPKISKINNIRGFYFRGTTRNNN